MASYIDQIRGRDEDLVATARITNWIWFVPVVLTIVSFGLLFPILLFPFIRQWTTELGVTNRRVISKTGLISRHTVEQRIQKIESIRIDQGILGRILNYGTILIHGTGGAVTPVALIASPLIFKRAVENVVDEYERSPPEPLGGR